jgi:hypothetical protein
MKPLRIIQWKAQSLYKCKLKELKYYIRCSNPHIVLLNETFWRDEYIPKFNEFSTFYLKRKTHGSGIAILVKKYPP